MDGIDQRAVENSRSHPAGRSGAGRRARSALERSSQSVGRRFVDSAHRRAVAGPAAPVRAIPDGPSPLPKLGAFRGHGKTPLDAGPAPQGSRRLGPQGMLCGRNLCSGQKRGRCVGKTKRGKGTKIMGIADGHGLPLALRAESASPAEVTLVEATLEERAVADVPERLIGDKAYDSDRLDERLMERYGTEMIAP